MYYSLLFISAIAASLRRVSMAAVSFAEADTALTYSLIFGSVPEGRTQI